VRGKGKYQKDLRAANSEEAAKLLPFCRSDNQREKMAALEMHGSLADAAQALGCAETAVKQTRNLVRNLAAARGFSPEHDYTRPVPEGFVAKGVSTYYNKDGQVSGQWVKSSIDGDKARALAELAIAALTEDIRGTSTRIKAPAACMDDLLVVYPFGDPHFGMYAWSLEAGDDFDVNIARELTLAAVDRLVEAAPPASTAIILPLGDIFHMDNSSNQTPASKHPLDADGRFVKVMGVCIQTFRHAITRALEKHQKVVVRFVKGNHDPHAVWALAFTIAAFFDGDPRVEVDLSPAAFWYYRFGKVLIGSTHGDTTKHKDLLGVMASDRAEDWGQTKYRYWYTGHVHNQIVTELAGVTCESFRTLAAKDAWAAGAGYRAGRDMRAIVHHKDWGEIERHRCDVGMLS
jgi:hypothetical protein